MQPIILTGFAGSQTATKPRLLDEHVGIAVYDARPALGDLRALRAALLRATVPTGTQQQTIFRFRQGTADDTTYWLSWPSRVTVARAIDANDTTERIYFTGDGPPKWTDNVIGLGGGAPYPQSARLLAVPAPLGAPFVSLTTDGTGTAGDRFYVSTFVNDLGWESAPSAVSGALNCKPGAIVAIASLPLPPTGNYGITARRIYRTQPGTAEGAASFFFLREIAVGATSTTDDARALGEPIATIGWLPLPDDAHSLINLWNGMMAALAGKTLYFTEPNSSYAAPIRNSEDIADKPVTLARWSQNLLVLTEGPPRVFNGQDSSTMTETPFSVGFSCAAAKAVVGFEHGVVWASNEGLAYTGSQVLITEGIIEPEQWKALNPPSMIAGRWRNLYVCSYLPVGQSVRRAFMFNPLAPQLGIWYVTTGFDACYYDELADELYVLEGGSVKRFNGSNTALAASFTSKVFRQLAPRNFGFAKVVSETYPVTLRVWAGPNLKCNRTIANDRPITVVPADFREADWQIEVIGDGIEAVQLAADIRDFRVR